MADVNSIFKAMATRRQEALLEEKRAAEAEVVEETYDAPAEVSEEVEEEEYTNEMDPEIVEALEAEGVEVTEENYNAVVDVLNSMIAEEEVEEPVQEEVEEEVEEELKAGSPKAPSAAPGSGCQKFDGQGKDKAPTSGAAANGTVDQTPSKPKLIEKGKAPSISYEQKAMKLREEFDVDEETALHIVEMIMAEEAVVTEEDDKKDDKCPKCGKSPCACDKKDEACDDKKDKKDDKDEEKKDKKEEDDKKADCSEKDKCEEQESEDVVVEEQDDIVELQCRLEECQGSQYMMTMLAEGKTDIVKRYLSLKNA